MHGELLARRQPIRQFCFCLRNHFKVRKRCPLFCVLIFGLLVIFGMFAHASGPLIYRRYQGEIKIPESLQNILQSLQDLEGRHSDVIKQSLCNDPENKYQWPTNKSYDFIGPFDYLPNFKNPCFLEKGTLKCLPYFYIIGAPKAGSSDLYTKINKHPQILHGPSKEIRWFDRRRFGEGISQSTNWRTFDDFVDFFSRATRRINISFTTVAGVNYHNHIIGDGSPTYYFSSYYWKKIPGNEGCSEPRVTVMSHIHHLWAGAKLLMVVRNPVARLYSSYLFNANVTGANKTPEEFHEWLEQSMDVWSSCMNNHSFRYCMYEGTVDWKSKLFELHIGRYSRYILDVLKIFPRSQLLVVPLEDYSVNTVEWLRKIFSFLSVDPLPEHELKTIARMEAANANEEKDKQRPMLEKTKKLLEDYYKPFNTELAFILNDEKFLWINS